MEFFNLPRRLAPGPSTRSFFPSTQKPAFQVGRAQLMGSTSCRVKWSSFPFGLDCSGDLEPGELLPGPELSSSVSEGLDWGSQRIQVSSPAFSDSVFPSFPPLSSRPRLSFYTAALNTQDGRGEGGDWEGQELTLGEYK